MCHWVTRLNLDGDGNVVEEPVRLPPHPSLLSHPHVDGGAVGLGSDAATRRPGGAAQPLVAVEDLVLAARHLLQVDRALQRVPRHVHQEAIRPVCGEFHE